MQTCIRTARYKSSGIEFYVLTRAHVNQTIGMILLLRWFPGLYERTRLLETSSMVKIITNDLGRSRCELASGH